MSKSPSSWPSSTGRDRKSTRLNSSHLGISYAVFCLKKKAKGASGPRQKSIGVAYQGRVLTPLGARGAQCLRGPPAERATPCLRGCPLFFFLKKPAPRKSTFFPPRGPSPI